MTSDALITAHSEPEVMLQAASFVDQLAEAATDAYTFAAWYHDEISSDERIRPVGKRGSSGSS